jgi:DNA-binding beta-propeller fold protein YncE
VGERGEAAGQFQEPRGIALDGQGAVYVADFYGERVQKFRLLPPLTPSG